MWYSIFVTSNDVLEITFNQPFAILRKHHYYNHLKMLMITQFQEALLPNTFIPR